MSSFSICSLLAWWANTGPPPSARSSVLVRRNDGYFARLQFLRCLAAPLRLRGQQRAAIVDQRGAQSLLLRQRLHPICLRRPPLGSGACLGGWCRTNTRQDRRRRALPLGQLFDACALDALLASDYRKQPVNPRPTFRTRDEVPPLRLPAPFCGVPEGYRRRD